MSEGHLHISASIGRYCPPQLGYRVNLGVYQLRMATEMRYIDTMEFYFIMIFCYLFEAESQYLALARLELAM